VDISIAGEIKKTLDEAIARARKLEGGGELEKAGVLWEKASILMLKWSEYAPRRDEEFQRKKWAIQYRERAARLKAGEPAEPPPRKTETRAPEKKSRPAKKEKDDASEIRRAVSQLIHYSPITWDDIGGLETTKEEIKFALGVSLARQPSGVRIRSWRNILFYGPPGTGKTLLAAATSNALTTSKDRKAMFFNVKVSSVLSKYFGESTKIISELYGTARDTSPAVVFLDEFESLAASRDEGEHTGPERRILSTILAELDGLAEKGRSEIYVLTIAATNRPWDLDAAVLSRFEKKILIPLPDEETRTKILEILLDRRGFRVEVPRPKLVKMTRGFSGREIERFCTEASNRMIRQVNANIPALFDKGFESVQRYQLKVRDLTQTDFDTAASLISPQTSAEDMKRYVRWSETLEEA
jgi:SpoVK/Ycf46/Vps4 family AAA+-type ATPase